MNKCSLKKPIVRFSLTIFLMISISIISNNLSYAYVEFDVGGTGSTQMDLRLVHKAQIKVPIVMHHQMRPS